MAIADDRPFSPNALLLSHADAVLDTALLQHDPEIARELLYADDDAWAVAWHSEFDDIT